MSLFGESYIPGIKNPIKRRAALVGFALVTAVPLFALLAAGVVIGLWEGGGGLTGVRWLLREAWKDVSSAYAEGWRGE